MDKKLLVLCLIVASMFLVDVVRGADQVTIDLLYWNPRDDIEYCDYCHWWQEAYQKFQVKNDTLNNIQTLYGNKTLVKWIDYYSELGAQKRQQYNISQTNSVIINNETILQGDFDDASLKLITDAYLRGERPPTGSSSSQMPLIAVISFAFSLGFFDTFSPCLIVLLSFILSYSIGKATRFKEGTTQVTCFGGGFVMAALLLGLASGLLFLHLQSFHIVLTWIVVVFAIFFGFNQLGLYEKISLETKPIIQRLSKKYISTYKGLFALGFVFYFLDACNVPIFIALLPLLGAEHMSVALLMFAVGLVIPFFFIGLLAGSLSKITRTTYKHKDIIHAISGLILIGYASYLIIFHLLKVF